MAYSFHRRAGQKRAGILALCVGAALLPAAASAQTVPEAIPPEVINSAALDGVATRPLDAVEDDARTAPDPAVVKLQVLLDRAGASPGVIDGYDGDNVRKAIRAIEGIWGLPVDGLADTDLLTRLETTGDVMVAYTIAAADTENVTGPVPEDYSEMARMEFVGFATVAEAIAEKFHMDEDLLDRLNPGASFAVGDQVVVADPGPPIEGLEVTRIEADKGRRQVRVYDSAGALVVAYPATIGSASNPSPSGTHQVVAVAPEPNYTYDPANFQQGDNTEAFIIPPGPNNPVGSTWIDLSEPGYGLHGTPEPALIDKTASHGCVRLTNWDAAELAGLVSQGVTVTFLE